MFTPPPSPIPFPQDVVVPANSSAEKLSLTTPEKDPGFPFPHIPPSSLQSPSGGEIKTPYESKKRTGRRILLLVFLLPALLVLSASLRHLLRISRPHSPLIVKRVPQELGVSSAASPTATAASTTESSASGTTPTAVTLPTVPSSPPVLPTPLPQPFDITLTNNFSTQSCQAFFSDFVQDEEFRQCRAFSFLLNSSSAFLDAQHNLTLFNSILWATCNTPRSADTCEATMNSYISRLNSDCHQDMADGNQATLQAQIGFQSYTAMRSAACLMDPKSNSYCYIEALAAPDPADVYFYALPLGTPLPPSIKPSCSPCVKSVLDVYAQYVDAPPGSGIIQAPSETGNTTVSAASLTPLPALGKSYPAAARLAVDKCGGTYASVGVAKPSSGALSQAVPWRAVLLALVLALPLA